MVAPALPAMARELKVTNSVEQSLILSIFALAYAVGPLFLGPLSEINGRVIVLQQQICSTSLLTLAVALPKPKAN